LKSRFINFRQAADEIMDDINVTQELKDRVLGRRKSRRGVPAAGLAAMAACAVLIFGILNFSGVLRNGYQPDTQDIQGTDSAMEANIFSATAEQSGTKEQTGIQELTGSQPGQTGAQPGQSFGSAFLTPSYIPEGFQLAETSVTGTDEKNADKIILSYVAEERTFIITEERMTEAGTFPDNEAIDINEAIDNSETVVINGTEGYRKADSSGSQVHWFKDGVHYSVSGQITVEEAVKVARSMKPFEQGQ